MKEKSVHVDELKVGSVTLTDVTIVFDSEEGYEYEMADVICLDGLSFRQVTIEDGAGEMVLKEDVDAAIETYVDTVC